MKNKTALITGASRGIGKALAFGLAEEGYDVVLTSTKSDLIEEHAQVLRRDYDVDVLTYAVDVRNREGIFSMVDDVISQWDHIDVLVNNAGLCGPSGGCEAPYQEFVDQIDVNVLGALNVIQAVVPHMKKQQSGYIFNMSSFSGKFAKPSRFTYAPSKFALTGMSEALFHELADFHIKVTAICPRYVPTDMTKSLSFSDDEKLQLEDLINTVNYCLHLSKNAVVKEIHLDCRKVAADFYKK